MNPSALKTAREARGLSVRKLAILAGVSSETVKNAESGIRTTRGVVLVKIINALNAAPILPTLQS